MKILITGGAGFVGSHVAEFYAKEHEVIAYDNLSRSALLGKKIHGNQNVDYLRSLNVSFLQKDILDFDALKKAAAGCDVIFHAAAQTAVTASMEDPALDFETNARGTFNVMEAARACDVKNVIYCSTNKVYGENVNDVPLEERKTRYAFAAGHAEGIAETFSIDRCEHTPYGVSKLTGDLYVQDYGKLYGIKTGVFRMSCIYGPRQLGLEDQGWVAWFAIAGMLGKPITIYGDGKQVRDVLYVKDLVRLYDAFLKSNKKWGVYNAGGGKNNSLSLLEYVAHLSQLLGKEIKPTFADWRPSDQKVFISDVRHAEKELGWKPTTSPEQGLPQLIEWTKKNIHLFS